MSRDGRVLLTLEQRLARMEQSRAASPEAAVGKVLRISKTHPGAILFSDDIDSMYSLNGEFWEILPNDFDHYFDFVECFRLAKEDYLSANCEDPFYPAWGVDMVNSLVLLALIFIDQVKNKKQNMRYDLRMSLEDYLDAFVDLSYQKSGELDRKRVEIGRLRKERFLKKYDASLPLRQVLTQIVSCYTEEWKEFDHLFYVSQCIMLLRAYQNKNSYNRALLRRVVAEMGDILLDEGQAYVDPEGYFFALAYEYDRDLPDLVSEELPIGAVREQIFLKKVPYQCIQNYTIWHAPTEQFQKLVKDTCGKERLQNAKRVIDSCAEELYEILVEPYLDLKQYHFERHL